jgi:hypothetical protein
MMLLRHLRFGLGDEFPELGVVLERGVLGDRQAGAEEKILESIAAKDAMHHHAQFVPLEVNPVIPEPKAMQRLAASLQLPEVLQLGLHDRLGQPAKLPQDVQLQFLGHARQLGGTGRIENDLKGAH